MLHSLLRCSLLECFRSLLECENVHKNLTSRNAKQCKITEYYRENKDKYILLYVIVQIGELFSFLQFIYLIQIGIILRNL